MTRTSQRHGRALQRRPTPYRDISSPSIEALVEGGERGARRGRLLRRPSASYRPTLTDVSSGWSRPSVSSSFIAQTDCQYVRQEVCGEIVRVVLLEKCERQLHADEDAEAHAWSQTLAGERSVAALSSVAQRGGQGSVTGVLCCVDAMKELHAQAVVCCSCCWLATVLKCSSFHRRSALRGAPPTRSQVVSAELVVTQAARFRPRRRVMRASELSS